MEQDNKIAQTRLPQAGKRTQSSYCNSIERHNNEIIPSHGDSLVTRVYHYRMSRIPVDEDRWNFCGHLEPAKVKVESDFLTFHPIVICWMIILLTYGIWMIISPEDNPIPGHSCDPYDAGDCFFTLPGLGQSRRDCNYLPWIQIYFWRFDQNIKAEEAS